MSTGLCWIRREVPVSMVQHPVVFIWKNNQAAWNTKSEKDVSQAWENEYLKLTVATRGRLQCFPSQEDGNLYCHE
jgi:hypothetical protein